MAPRERREALREQCLFCARPENLKATGRIAVAVGVVLTGINEGDVFVSGHLHPILAVKVPLNFVVPFVVSNLGLLAGTAGDRRRREPE